MGVRVGWVDVAKGIAILLVVVFHAVQATTSLGIDHPAWLYCATALKTLRMPLFFLTAGLFARGWIERPWRRLLRDKVLLFVWVFLLWSVIRFTALSLDPEGRSVETGSITLLFKLAVWPQGGWFLYALAIFFVLARVTRRVDPRIQLAAAGLVSAVWFSGVHLDNFAWDGTGLYYVFFLAGVYYRHLAFTWAENGALMRALAVPLWVVLYVVAEQADVLHVPGVGLAVSVVAVAAGISLATFLMNSRFLGYVGQRTLVVYMTNQLILLAIAFVVTAFGTAPSGPVVKAAAPVALAAFATGTGLFVAWVAPRVRAGWLFDSPAWARSLFDAAWKRVAVRAGTASG